MLYRAMQQRAIVSFPVTRRPDVAFSGNVTQHAFDPTALAQRQNLLEQRLLAALERIGDRRLIERVRAPLTGGTAAELFELLADDDRRVARAAHECAMLRFAFVVAIVAQSMAFDADRRDDLVQRTFLNLPEIVRRSMVNGVGIPNPEGWLAYRAHLMARQMFREERGSARREPGPGALRSMRSARTHGRRVDIESIDAEVYDDDDAIASALDDSAMRDELSAALRTLGSEHALWAEVLRLHYMEGLRLDEIAARLGRSHGTVRNDALRARARLASIIRQQHPSLERGRTDASGEERDDVAG
jgi:RNA polymerase sigma factor (sigma-70 family)